MHVCLLALLLSLKSTWVGMCARMALIYPELGASLRGSVCMDGLDTWRAESSRFV